MAEYGTDIVTFYGPSGQIQFCKPQTFIPRIKRQIVNQECVRVIQKDHSQFDFSGKPGELPNAEVSIQEKIYKQKKMAEIRHSEIVRFHQSLRDSHAFLRELLEPKLIQFAVRELNHALMQKRLDFRCKDLNMNQLLDMSCKFAENFGNDGLAIDFHFNKYQKFLAITDPEDFMIYHTEPLPSALDLKYIFHGAFAVINPSRWVIAQYERPEYYKEMAHVTRHG